MRNAKFFSLLLMLVVLWAQSIYAAETAITTPITLTLNDNEQIALLLSNVDINRLFVKDDKITTLQGPQQLYTVKNDESGSVYIALLTQEPFTLFVSTENGFHFSLLVTPRAIVGRTYQLTALQNHSRAAHWEKTTAYESSLITLMKAMMGEDDLPEGYGISTVKDNKALTVNPSLQVTLLKNITGEVLQGLVYRVSNTTASAVNLRPNQFYAKGIRAIALEHQTLAPHATALLYEIVAFGE